MAATTVESELAAKVEPNSKASWSTQTEESDLGCPTGRGRVGSEPLLTVRQSATKGGFSG